MKLTNRARRVVYLFIMIGMVVAAGGVNYFIHKSDDIFLHILAFVGCLSWIGVSFVAAVIIYPETNKNEDRHEQ